MEQVIAEVRRNLVVIKNGFRFSLVLKLTLEEVKRAIVLVVDQVFHILHEGQSEFEAIIVLSYFELSPRVLLK